MSFDDSIARIGRVLDAAKAINRALPENLETACFVVVPPELLVELRRAIRAVRDSKEKPCIHSRHTAWMHEVGYGHLCEEEA